MPNKAQYAPNHDDTNAFTIANGAQTSDEMDTCGLTLIGLELPAAFTGTTITFTRARTAGGTHVAVYDDAGTAYSVAVGASRFIRINPAYFKGSQFIKIVSGSAEGAARTVYACLDNI